MWFSQIFKKYIKTGTQKRETGLYSYPSCNVRSLHWEVQSIRRIKYQDIKTKIMLSFLSAYHIWVWKEFIHYIYVVQSNIFRTKFIFHEFLNFAIGFDLLKLIHLGEDAASPAILSYFETFRQVFCFKFCDCILQSSSSRKGQTVVREKKKVAWYETWWTVTM
jgi:hypothetical protein